MVQAKPGKLSKYVLFYIFLKLLLILENLKDYNDIIMLANTWLNTKLIKKWKKLMVLLVNKRIK